jgi:hypothetical protein
MMGVHERRVAAASGLPAADGRLTSPSALRKAALEMARDALRRVGSSRMTSVAYDSGFVARLTPILPNEPVVQGAARYLAATQLDDGSWGSPVYNAHDRALNTLSALAGLAASGEALHSRRVERGLEAVRRVLAAMNPENQLVGSDLLLPPLVERCADLGLDVDPGEWPYRKVGRLAQALYGRTLYSGHPVGHLIELTGEGGNPVRMFAHLMSEPSGSVMCAPSSTAFAIERSGKRDPRALGYLRLSQNSDGGQRHFGPYELMEAAYALYALRRSPLIKEQAAASALRLLREAWMPTGVAFSREFPAVDLDDSVLAALAITASGERVSPDFLDHYASDEYFLCYLTDRRGAVAPNLHAIEALHALNHPQRGRLTEVALNYVRTRVRPDGSFLDHYSLSPNYPTWHAIEALVGVDDRMAERAAVFLAASQRTDGSWAPTALSPSTAEDTAYALLGLCSAQRLERAAFMDEIEQGARWLIGHRDLPALPTWIAKVLYSPTTMAQASVAGALFACADALEAADVSLSPDRIATEVPHAPRAGAAPLPEPSLPVAKPIRGF